MIFKIIFKKCFLKVQKQEEWADVTVGEAPALQKVHCLKSHVKKSQWWWHTCNLSSGEANMWILGGHWLAKLEYLVNVRLVRDCLTNQNQKQDSALGRQSNTFFTT